MYRKVEMLSSHHLYQEYVINHKSTTDIALDSGVDSKTIYRWLKKSGIKIRSRAEARSLQGSTITEDSRRKIAKSREQFKGSAHPFFGTRHSTETKRKISDSRRGKCPSGSSHPNWKGGVSSVNRLIRGLPESKEWRIAIFERDNFTCQHCNKVGGTLNADHIKPFSKIIKDNHVTSIEEARQCQELWNTDNGRTLCLECHKKTPTYSGRVNTNA